MQQFLKPTPGVAWAWVIAPELLEKLLVSVHDAVTALHASLGWETLAAFTRGLETRTVRGVQAWFSWHTSICYMSREWGRGLYEPPARSASPVLSEDSLPYNNMLSGARDAACIPKRSRTYQSRSLASARTKVRAHIYGACSWRWGHQT
jgi:hypothetical protein